MIMAEKKKKALFVDDDPSQVEVAKYRLEEAGHIVKTASNGREAFDAFLDFRPDVVITDLKMPELTGMELMVKVKSVSPDTVFIVITAHGSIDSAVEAMKAGAYDYIQKPFDHKALLLCVEKAMRVSSLIEENRYLRQVAMENFRFESIVGASKKMREVFGVASQVAPKNATALLLGESGTGKELLAKAIHFNSPRKDKPFVAINMAAIPENLIDSELFGHEKGSFTGAHAARTGKFELADGGTLFLDEIGSMKPDLQARLLRVLQERQIEKVGGSRPIDIDVRIIAATNENLEEKIAAGEFREDLFYRLNVVTITLPPLRERVDDIPMLIDRFVEKFSVKFGAPRIRFSDDALRALLQYPWPGNVRELENVIERCAAVSASGAVSAADLPEKIRRPGGTAGRIFIDLPDDGISLYQIEKAAIERALEKNNFNQSKTARFLQIPRNTLIYRMEKLEIPKN